MFRLMKLMAFAFFGYALYEFFRGMSESGGGGGGGGIGRAMGRSMGEGTSESFGVAPGRGQLTGSGMGREEETLNTDGGSVPHRVGRGAMTM